MNTGDLMVLLPFIILLADALAVMLAIAFYRDHRITAVLTLAGLALAAASLPFVSGMTPRQVTALVVIDNYTLYYWALIFSAVFAITALSYSYLAMLTGDHEEYYLLLLTAALGASVLAAATHFASLFLGLEVLSVSLYALAAYQRHNDRCIEAGVKYLILAAVSSAFILFGMALVYAQTGTMEFEGLAARAASGEMQAPAAAAGILLIIVGLGFKLAVVPFHMWTPDVYEGAPAPVSAFIATVSKGAVFALVLRFFGMIDLPGHRPLFLIFTIIAVASMFAGNLLALLQTNVKRILAYSSISHMGYLLVTLLALAPINRSAAAYYLAAYFVTMLGAFGVVTVLSTRDREAARIDDYRGLAWRKPWIAGIFTAMLLSLAGIPLTAGFIAKFYLVAAGVSSALWFLAIMLVINSALSLYYYLRIVIAIYGPAAGTAPERASVSGSAALAGLAVLLVWFGVYPGPLLSLIERMMQELT